MMFKIYCLYVNNNMHIIYRGREKNESHHHVGLWRTTDETRIDSDVYYSLVKHNTEDIVLKNVPFKQ